MKYARYSTFSLLGVGLASAALLAPAAHAGPLAIANASFESPDCTAPGACVAGVYTLSVPDWSLTGSGGVFAPNLYPATASAGFAATHGTQVAWGRGGTLSQVLAATLTPDTTYALSVDVGFRPDVVTAGYAIELRAGSELLASAGPAAPTAGFFTETLSYSAHLTDVALGQSLSVHLIAMPNGQVNWDNVRLDASATAAHQVTHTPVPAALPLLASALAGLGLVGWRRRS
jgi:hypothetical protein